MNGIVKICKIHGDLTADQCNIEKRHDDKAKIYYRCHQCKVAKTHRYYAKNKDAILDRIRVDNLPPERRAKMQERVKRYKQTDTYKEYRVEYYQRNKEVLGHKAKARHQEIYPLIKEKVQARRREIRAANIEEVNAKRRAKYIPRLAVPRRKVGLHPREYQRQYRDKNKARQQGYIKNLTDHYVKQQLKLGSFKLDEVPKELLELKRAVIKIRRVLRNENK